ncbi:Esterase/lipase [[Actinomadura] parvosata subsp. kistnae]|uniref:Esterase n=1 Tax=[Actinomadura] parvosata subsp. kistnae TaxID=1909395 RepID=A0A1U9ZWF0_9ACTN|nr:alpha/beta hydrolase [Nonomuraea sp. ATCC 55076]AQZ62278.1 esterase [Nonomuraea sp. ATCC 55076]SPL99725.1 Esterase/lipase [Actinomadura parvosata subsp. kistnae]
MTVPATTGVVLEPTCRRFLDRALRRMPSLHEMEPAKARAAFDDLQSDPVDLLPVDERWVTVPASVGEVAVRLVRPRGAAAPLPVVLYLHGGGWVLGNAFTHDRLVRELAVGACAAVAFVEYTNAPEARYPVAIEQGYAVARWIGRQGAAYGLDPDRVAVAGDSSGGNMAAALTLMAKQRGDVRFVHQSLYYPITDAVMDTGSYRDFATGYLLTARAMARFWDEYLPDAGRRREATASPLRATMAELTGLPPAFVVVGEADVLRDEGEAYAAKLRAAGVRVTTVRYDGTIHGFMTLNELSDTCAGRAATAQAVAMLRSAFGA